MLRSCTFPGCRRPVAWVVLAAVAATAMTGGAAPPAAAPLRRAPRPLRPGDHGVGRLVPARTFVDLDGRGHGIAAAACRFTVFAMTSTSCPLSRKQLPALAELFASLPEQVRLVLVDPIATDSSADLRRAADRFAGRAICVHDADASLARSVGALTTTDVVVVDATRTVVYHGAIDDQYGFGYALDEPRHRYLADAVTALLAGDRPALAATDAPGCELELGTAAPPAATITYHGRVSRILQAHCVECHRDGGVAPFPLDSAADVAAHAAMIRSVVDRGTMPPWFAAPDDQAAGSADGAGRLTWANDRSLAAAEKADLLGWLAAGAALGDPADAPAPRSFASGWLIGEPDAIWEFAEPVAVKATGIMPYQNVVVETGLTEERWVQAIEVRPGNRDVVHHVLVHVIAAGDEGGGQREDGDAGAGFWAAYVPGQSTMVYPPGYAKRLPRGCRLRFQMHYTPSGTAVTDRTRIGVRFAAAPPRHEVKVAGIMNTKISIPPGAADHREDAVRRLPFDVALLSFMPHMHLRGKACRYELVARDGTAGTLLDIPHYDFNWQLLYRRAEPLVCHAGDTIRFTAWYDNSAGNPANPDPTSTVRWGQQTFDEMHLGYVEYFVPGETPAAAGARLRRRTASE